MPRQFQVPDDSRVEQRNRVGGHGVAKAGMKFLGYRGSADDRAALEHGHFEAGGRKIRGADQSVVAAADNDDVAQRFSRSHERLPAPLIPPAPLQPAPGECSRLLSGITSR